MQGTAGAAAGRFLIDTGAQLTVLDLAFAARAGVTAQGHEVVQGPNGGRAASRGTETLVALTGGPRVKVTPSITDLSPIARTMGERLDGVIGGDLLGGFQLSLDYRGGTVRLDLPGARPAPASAALMRVGRTPYVMAAATVGGVRRLAEFQIDTGSNTAVVFTQSFAAKAFPPLAAGRAAQIAVGGVMATRSGQVSVLEVAGTRLINLYAEFADDTAADDAGRDYAGSLGGQAWRGRQITLDYPGRKFWIA